MTIQVISSERHGARVYFELSAKNKNAIISFNPEISSVLEFFKIRGSKVKPISEVEGVYCDNLQSVFTDRTGLETSL